MAFNMNTEWKSTHENIGRGMGMRISTRQFQVDHHSVVDVCYKFSNSPTGSSIGANLLRSRLGVRSCTYMFFKASDYEEIGDNLYHPLIGYIGETGDFVNRMNDIRMSFNNPKYSVYHGLGRYLRRNKIDLNSLICRVIPTEYKHEALALEQSIQMECRKRYGKRFAWEDGASSGKGSAVHKALDLIECIEDPIELDTLVKFIQMQRKVINGKKVRSN